MRIENILKDFISASLNDKRLDGYQSLLYVWFLLG